MDVAEPANVALPSGTAAVLRALAGTDTPLTIRQLARVAEVSSTRAQQVIARLAEHGVVTTEDHGQARLCLLNRDHLATDPLILLADLRVALIAKLRLEVGSWPTLPEHASLFGSAARGDGDTTSDLDILLVPPPGLSGDEPAWTEQLSGTAERLRRATGNNVAWFEVSRADLRRAVRAKEPIVDEWHRDAIRLAGVDLPTILRSIK